VSSANRVRAAAIIALVAACVLLLALWSSDNTAQPIVQATPSSATAAPTLSPSPVAVVPATPTPTPVPTEGPVRGGAGSGSALLTAERPLRDLRDLATRYGRDVPLSSGLDEDARTPSLGDIEDFWVSTPQPGYARVKAALRAVTDRAYIWVETDLSVTDAALQQASTNFDVVVYPAVSKFFAPVESPFPSQGPHVNILVTRLLGLAGYQSSADSYPAWVHRYSNERDIIYVSPNSGPIGSSGFASLVAHELQHLFQWYSLPGGDNWINEGSSELAVQLAGYRVRGSDSAYLASPDTQLTAWASDIAQSGAHYGASYLFMSYFTERFGPEALVDLFRSQGRGPDLFNYFLASQGSHLSFDDLFADWTVANLIDEPDIEDGRYGYRHIDPRVQRITNLGLSERVMDGVSQYAARYYQLPAREGGLQIEFDGSDTARLLPVQPRSGLHYWWGNRGDVMNARLTLPIDLTEVDDATLRFWTWFDIEEHYDYAYVSISDDGGKTWNALSGKHTSSANPTGNAMGPGFTGRSGGGSVATWVEEKIDISRYTGKKVLLRFKYVTDDGFNGGGFVVDDIAIPEIKFTDDAETDGRWIAEGFVRTDNEVPQRFALNLVRETKSGATVQAIELDEEQWAEFIVPEPLAGEKQYLIVAALAPVTTERTEFSLALRAAP
jgi:immune inhibitor A